MRLQDLDGIPYSHLSNFFSEPCSLKLLCSIYDLCLLRPMRIGAMPFYSASVVLKAPNMLDTVE